ncbi:phage major capsid protein, partial [Mycobacterium tuberculosis]|nr:phage major capsid protein [Mycobacterium tuberculosis]
MELYAMPAASSSLLDDAAVDVEQWISSEVETAFAEQEGQAFINGNGTSQPKGFLTYDSIADAIWSWGKLGSVSTGIAGGFAASNA